MSMLSLLILLPLLAATGLVFVPREYRVVPRLVAVAVTALVALLGLVIFWQFPAGAVEPQFVATLPWLGAESLGIQCRLGVDGMNVGLVFMGAVVAFAAACVSWDIAEREKEFYILLLVMTGGILGAFASLDLFFFYFFHELALVPTFLMIGLWGRGADRGRVAYQITIYLSLGALIALVGLVALYLQMPAGARTFDIAAMTRHFAAQPMSVSAQHCLFPMLLVGFGILVSLWPFHSWAAPGYAAAPTATAMLHAGVLKKFGLYGLLRIAAPMMPEGARCTAQILAILCLGNILYCGLVALRQRDLNLLIGNSSVAHMGFIFLGLACLNTIGLTGALVVMVAHGFLAALTFGLTGWVHHHAGTLEMDRLGGLMQRMPFAGSLLLMALLAGCGLPGFANFVGEALTFIGAWKVFPWVTVLAVWGALVIGGVYMLRAIRRVLHGPVAEGCETVADAENPWRRLPYLVLLVPLLVFGFVPGLLTGRIQPAVAPLVRAVEAAARPPAASVPPAATARVAPDRIENR